MSGESGTASSHGVKPWKICSIHNSLNITALLLMLDKQ